MTTFWMISLFWCCIAVLSIFQLSWALPPDSLMHFPLPIRVAFSIDSFSFKDITISMQAVLRAAYQSTPVFFHVVACDKNEELANNLALNIRAVISNCFGSDFKNFVVKPFHFPVDSGFYLQMHSSKVKSHWNSNTGADMVRFFLGEIFPDVDKLLYLDNDVIVSCCLEEIWSTDLQGRVAGIALDDLKWATVTQFQRQYNSSHPLVIRNIRRNQSEDHWVTPIGEEEFWKALPRYPNDGVLLFSIQKYNEYKILATIDEIAKANAKDYVVGLGTQQFTVLGMHDRWIELTPRANLRHFPDMARGFLMWFLYNGFIHYAGASKPRQICSWKGVQNEHRIATYTPWITAVNDLAAKCPSETSLEAFSCTKHLLQPKTFIELMHLAVRLMDLSKDSQLLYLRLGEFEGEYTRGDYYHSFDCLDPENAHHSHHHHSHHYNHPTTQHSNALNASSGGSYSSYGSHNNNSHTNGNSNSNSNSNGNSNSNSNNNDNSHHYNDIAKQLMEDHSNRQLCQTIHFFDRLALHNSSWSGRIFHFNSAWVSKSQSLLDRTKYPRLMMSHSIKKKKNSVEKTPERKWMAVELPLCMAMAPIVPGHPIVWNSPNCRSILQNIKDEEHKHWDVIFLTVDLQTPWNSSQWESPSLQALRALDLEFMRPKIVLVRLGMSWIWNKLQDRKQYEHQMMVDLTETEAILRRNNYNIVMDKKEIEHMDSTMTMDSKELHKHWRHCNDNSEAFRCLWATRINAFEMHYSEYY